MPARRSRCDSTNPAGPAPTIATWVDFGLSVISPCLAPWIRGIARRTSTGAASPPTLAAPVEDCRGRLHLDVQRRASTRMLDYGSGPRCGPPACHPDRTGPVLTGWNGSGLVRGSARLTWKPRAGDRGRTGDLVLGNPFEDDEQT